jgi:predicted ribosome-associated RNA-binding protein Tma20
VPRIFLNEKVEQFIFNGANLMWPGVKNAKDLPDFKADDVY